MWLSKCKAGQLGCTAKVALETHAAAMCCQSATATQKDVTTANSGRSYQLISTRVRVRRIISRGNDRIREHQQLPMVFADITILPVHAKLWHTIIRTPKLYMCDPRRSAFEQEYYVSWRNERLGLQQHVFLPMEATKNLAQFIYSESANDWPPKLLLSSLFIESFSISFM